MPKKRGKQTKRKGNGKADKPLVVVMVPVAPARKEVHYGALIASKEEFSQKDPVLSEMVEDSKDLVSSARDTVKSLGKQLKKSNTVYKNVCYPGARSEQHKLDRWADSLTVAGSMLVISAHGNPNRIGTRSGEGITPELMAELLSYQFDTKLSEFKMIRVVSCNSGYYPRRKGMSVKHEQRAAMKSYAGRLHRCLVEEYNASSLVVQGVYGYYGEDTLKKKAYVTSRLESSVAVAQKSGKKTIKYRKVRFEQACLTITPTGVVLPTEKMPIHGVSMSDQSQWTWRDIWENLEQHSPDAQVAKVTRAKGIVHTGLFAEHCRRSESVSTTTVPESVSTTTVPETTPKSTYQR